MGLSLTIAQIVQPLRNTCLVILALLILPVDGSNPYMIGASADGKTTWSDRRGTRLSTGQCPSLIIGGQQMKRIVYLAGICAGLIVLGACSSSQPASGGDLTGQVWGLTELLGKPPVAGAGISAQFTTDGHLSGSAGCNQYAGSYTVSGNNITISKPLASTMMMCDPAVMTQETIYLITLGEAKTYAVKGDQLTLSAEAGLPGPIPGSGRHRVECDRL
jgi:heat shock protein HslJ